MSLMFLMSLMLLMSLMSLMLLMLPMSLMLLMSLMPLMSLMLLMLLMLLMMFTTLLMLLMNWGCGEGWFFAGACFKDGPRWFLFLFLAMLRPPYRGRGRHSNLIDIATATHRMREILGLGPWLSLLWSKSFACGKFKVN